MYMFDKVIIRRMIKKYKLDINHLYVEISSKHILHKLECHPRFIAASHISIYNALPDEPQTLEFIKKWSVDKEIYLPIIRDGILKLSKLHTPEDLILGKYNIFEPSVDDILTDYSNLDLIVIPGVAFDYQGNRLGRGKAYYDQLLSRPGLEHVYKIGLCFDFQKFVTLPAEPHDIRVDEVL